MGLICIALSSLFAFLASMTAVLVFKVGFGFGVILYFFVASLTPCLLTLISVIIQRRKSRS